MSTNGSDWLSVSGNRSPVASQAESLLLSISEITSTVESAKTERESFMEIGCFFYRVSIVIMECQSASSTPRSTTGILYSLSKSVDIAKEIVGRCNNGTRMILDSEIISTVEMLEGVIKQMGEDLSLMTLPAAYGDQEYVQIAVQSLVQEMKSARFEVNVIQRQPSKQKEEKKEPQDLYSIVVDDDELNVKSISGRVKLERERWSSGSSMNLTEVAQYMEPFYETFFCPLTKKIMEDPVTIESGVTYERKAISEWYQKYENQEDIICPKTERRIMSRALSTNMALKATIEQWEERNEAARIKVARSALAVAGSKTMVLEAVRDLQSLSRKKRYNKVQILNAGIVPFLGTLLETKDRKVRFETLELLLELAEDDDEAKVTSFLSPNQ